MAYLTAARPTEARLAEGRSLTAALLALLRSLAPPRRSPQDHLAARSRRAAARRATDRFLR